MKWAYNRQYILNLRDNNYFGSEDTGQSEERQEALQQAWIDAMTRKGWVLDEETIECLYDFEKFNADGDASLIEASKIVNAQ